SPRFARDDKLAPSCTPVHPPTTIKKNRATGSGAFIPLRSLAMLESRVYAHVETMGELWSLRGLSWRELAGRTCRRSWEDEVFGQAARLTFYYFLGIFPALLLLLVVLNTFTSTGSEFRRTLLDSFQQILPPDGSALITKTTGELNARAAIGAGAIWAVLGAAWAILNGTWAMIVGLNKAYGVKE